MAVDIGDKVSGAQVTHIFSGLESRQLPKEEWTHAAHLCAATFILRDRGLARAEEEMPDIIRAYNEATGGVNSDKEGYHHTITLFYLRRIDEFLRGCEQTELGETTSALLASDLADRSYPLRFYTRPRLFSVEARLGWVDPDL